MKTVGRQLKHSAEKGLLTSIELLAMVVPLESVRGDAD